MLENIEIQRFECSILKKVLIINMFMGLLRMHFFISEIKSRFTAMHTTALVPLALRHATGVSTENLKASIASYEEDLPSPLTAQSELECWMSKWRSPATDTPKTITDTIPHTTAYPNINTVLRNLTNLPVTRLRT